MEEQPRVAVVIPTYNRWPAVCDAINSVLAQSYPSVRAVIVDDASSDGSAEKLLEHYGGKIDLIALEKNGEKCRARNTAIEQAEAEFVCMLDSDDVLTPDSIQDRIRIFLADPDFTGVAYGAARYEGEDKSIPSYPSGRIFDAYLKDMSILNNNAFLIPRAQMLRFGMYHPDLTNMEDRELLLRLTSSLPFRFCGSFVQVVRTVGPAAGRDFARIIQQGRRLTEILRENEELAARLGPELERLEYLEDAEIARALYKTGRYTEYRGHYRRMKESHLAFMRKNRRHIKRYVLSFFHLH